MRQFDVVSNPSARSKGIAPYLVVLQSHYLIGIETTIVAPMYHPAILPPDHAFGLKVEFEGAAFTLALQQMSSVPVKRLGQVVGTVVAHDLEIARGWERLFTGF